jgi:hypothetical protein
MTTIYKICSKCKQEKNVTEFGRDKYKSDGIMGRCKACVKLDNARYRKNHSEEFKASGKKHYEANKATLNHRAAEYGKAPHRKAQRAAHHQVNKDRINASSRKWHKENGAESRKRNQASRTAAAGSNACYHCITPSINIT